MAMPVRLDGLGVDVAKDKLDLYDGKELACIDNTKRAIMKFLKTLSKDTPIAVEATNDYHELFMELALLEGYTVYLVDAFRLSHYRDAVGTRAKTDPLDARLIYRYLCSERTLLKPYIPAPKAVKQLMKLLRGRGKIVQSKTTIRQSLSNVPEIEDLRASLMKEIDEAVKAFEKKIKIVLKEAGYQEDYKRVEKIPGVGALNAAALSALFHRGEFRSADAFIAFIGLDVRVRDSGKYKGKRKLTKKGNPEVRRLLFNAGRAGAKSPQWRDYYLSLLDRGFSKTAAEVAIGRKIAKLAFALMRDQSEFRAKVA